MAGIKERLIQFILRGKDELSPAAAKSSAAIDELRQEAEKLGKALDSAKAASGLARGIDDTRRTLEQSRRALSQTEQQVRELREALNASPEAAGLQQSLKDAEREASRARRQIIGLTSKLEDQEKAARAAGVDVDNLSDEQQRLAAEVGRASAALGENTEQLKAAQRAAAAAARSSAEHASRVGAAREALSGGAKQALAFAAAFVGLNTVLGLVARGLAALRDGVVSMLRTGDQFEGLQTRMTALMGSLAAGEAATAWIKDFARTTPLQLEEVTEAFAQLKAYGVDPMDGTLRALVDQNEKLGGGMERLQGIIGAVGQAYAKNKLQTEEILQLVERGVPAWDLLAKVTGKNASQLEELASKGKLGRDVLAALVAEIGRTSTGAAEANMSRLSGLISNLKDQASDFLNRIAESGALDYVKGQFKALGDTISQMDADGRLDRLAKALSDAFIQGTEKLKAFVSQLVAVDFKTLADDSSAWLSDFGSKLDEVGQRVQLFVAPFRTLFNGLTAGVSLAGAALTDFGNRMLAMFGSVAQAVPESFGGERLRAAIADARQLLDGLTEGFLEQIRQDGKDIEDAWRQTAQSGADSAAAQTEAVTREADQQRALYQALADELVANQHRVKAAAIEAAVSGTQAIRDLGEAMQLLDMASTVQQLEGLRGALLKALSEGTLSQEQFAQATGLLNERLAQLQNAARGAGEAVSDLDDKLGDLQAVQQAIGNAKTDVDINNIRSALRRLYNDGEISAAQYNAELKKTSERQRELKGAVAEGTRAQQDKNQADREALVTSEQLRREAGKRLEAERKAGDAAMQARRKGSEEAKRDLSSMSDFVGGVMTRAREPLAAISAAALEAFDRLRGIAGTKVEIDTSDLSATAASLKRINEQLAGIKQASLTPGMSAFSRWQTQTQVQSLELQKSALGQKLALQSLMSRYESGAMTLRQFVSAAKGAKSTLGLLDEADLSGLESAIRSAEQQMRQMGESTRSTLESLQDELDGLEGRQADIERRRFAARQRELQAQLAEARAKGDSDAVTNVNRSLGLLRQIEAATAQQRQREEQEKRIEAAKPSTPTAPAPTPSKVIRLESRGKAVEVALANPTDETTLLGLLEDAGLRTL